MNTIKKFTLSSSTLSNGRHAIYLGLPNTVSPSLIEPMSTWNVASKTEELDFLFDEILINLISLSSHLCIPTYRSTALKG